MEHEDEVEQSHRVPRRRKAYGRRSIKSEEPGMEMSLTTDQLCAKAR